MNRNDQISNRTPDDTEGYPIPNPGIEPHVERYTDASPAAGKRAERQVVLLLALVPVFAVAFVVCYFAIPREVVFSFGPFHAMAQHLALGLTSGIATLLVGLACIHWAKQLMNDTEVSEERHPSESSPEDKAAMAEVWERGAADSGLPRRKVIGGALLGAMGFVAIPAVVSFADLGPHPGPGLRKETIEKTIWAEGVHLVNDVTYARIKASEMEIGQLVNGEPENLKDLHDTEYNVAKAKAAIVVVRMDPASIKIPESRKDWQVGGILCYSKICTHVGCPISLWERTTHHLLCPCHQSTFDLADSGVVVFGPAGHSLPQLPIAVDSEGYLVAKSDFTVPVGPSYFERDSRHDYKKGDR